MKRLELIERLKKKMPEKSKVEIGHLLNALFSEIIKALEQGDRVELRRFGMFYVGTLKARLGNDPRDRSEIFIETQYRPLFKSGMHLTKDI